MSKAFLWPRSKYLNMHIYENQLTHCTRHLCIWMGTRKTLQDHLHRLLCSQRLVWKTKTWSALVNNMGIVIVFVVFVVVLRCHQHSHCNAAVLMVTVALKVGTEAYLQVYTKFGLVVPLPDTSLEKANSLNVHLKHISVNQTKHSDCLCLCLMVKRYKPSWRLDGLLRSKSSRTSSVFVFVFVFVFLFFVFVFVLR